MNRHREQWAEYARKAGLLHDTDKPSSPPIARSSSPPGESPLEAELAGHFSVMGLVLDRQYKFHPERRWRLDFAAVDVLVGVEVDGSVFAAENGQTAGRHSRGKGIVEGYQKKNAAAELGWLILCYGPPQIRSGEAAMQVERIVKAKRALALREPCAVVEVL
jgi:hypothetical protein